MTKETWLLILLLCGVIGSFAYRKYVIRKTLQRLYKERMRKDEASYLQALNGLDVRLYFPAFTRELLKLNYYIAEKKHEEVMKHYMAIQKLKASSKDQSAMYSTMLGYFIEQKDVKNAKECVDTLYALLGSKKDKTSIALLNEVRQLDGIYLQKDPTWIAILEEILTQMKDHEEISVLQYRLAKLYYDINEKGKSKTYLMQAYENTRNIQAKEKLQYLMHHIQELA